ncbi:MAG: PfkB family carbohydrate kinase [Fervidobacterium sp.]|nr:PfkB family carbohydrate kinase [Fervidobacterium sp.]
MSVVCIGKVNIDIFYEVENLELNQNHISNEIEMNVGGKATNVSVALSKLGIKSYLIGKIGEDEFGKIALEKLKKFGVIPLLSRSKNTGITFIVVDRKGNSTMFNYLGANKELNIKDVLHFKEIISSSDIVFFQTGVNSQILQHIKEINQNIFVELTEPMEPSLLEGIKYISLNQHELTKVTDEIDLEKALYKLYSYGIKEIFLKLGQKGSMYYSKSETIFIESLKIDAVDTTGAGDAFTAGIIYSLLNNFDKQKTLKFANACGALTCLKKGTTEAFPLLEDVFRLLNRS